MRSNDTFWQFTSRGRRPSGRTVDATHSLTIAAFAMLAIGIPSVGQTVLSTEEKSDALRIVFLNQVHQLAQSDAKTKTILAENLGLQASELPVLFAAAQQFASEEQQIMNEARSYRADQRTLNRNLDLTVVHGFSTRRYLAALRAVTSVQSQLSPASSEAIARFVSETLAKSVHFWR